MASTQASVTLAKRQAPPVVRDLEAIFAGLPDGELLTALIGPVRRGPKGHPTTALWHAFVVKYHLGLASTDALIRALLDNPLLADVCGFTVVPHKSTFSRFYARLASPDLLPLVQAVFERMVRLNMVTLPGFGKRVALDSTTLKGWANGSRGKKTDPDGGWSVKGGTQGRQEAVFGYKLHLLVDTEYELPIAATVTAGNRHDSTQLPIVLREAKRIAPDWKPDAVIADKGYDGAPLFKTVHDLTGAMPIIDVRQQKRMGTKARELRDCEAYPVETLNGIRYKCNRVPWDAFCPQFGKCPLWPVFVDSPLNDMPLPYYHAYTSFPFGSRQWKALYSQRGAVERVFSRLKGQRALNRITVRRMAKVTVHCYLSLMALQAGQQCG